MKSDRNIRPLRIIPVMDLLGGQVVRAIAGRRSEYRPIESRLCRGSQPGEIARALVEQFCFTTGYVADLDAIAGREPAWDIYETIAGTGLSLWVDAGLRDLSTAGRHLRLIKTGTLSAVVVGLETLASLEQLREFLDLLGPSRVIFSLDLNSGRPLTQIEAWRRLPPQQIAAQVIDLGIRRLILLDLARVGTGQGIGAESVARALRQQHPQLELIGGGGLRGPQDFLALSVAGYDSALVASALHDGRITPEHLRIAD